MAEGAGAELDGRLEFSIRTLSVINPQSIPLIHNFFFEQNERINQHIPHTFAAAIILCF